MQAALWVQEAIGVAREDEPVRVGVPLPRGAIRGEVSARVEGLPAQAQILSRWGDGSARWVLLDFTASCPAHGTRRLIAEIRDALTDTTFMLPGGAPPPLAFPEEDGSVRVNAGPYAFILQPGQEPFLGQLATSDGAITGLGIELALALAGEDWKTGAADLVEVETNGPRRATVLVQVQYESKLNRKLAAHLRISTFANFPALLVQATLTNPNPFEREVLGRWPLGSKGSAYLKGFGLRLSAGGVHLAPARLASDPAADWQQVNAEQSLRIEQESSGGMHWDFRTHIDRHEKIAERYAGFRVLEGGKLKGGGLRAQPWLEALLGRARLGFGVREFWQNYPVALGTDGVNLELLSSSFGSGEHELQGGEAKTWDSVIAFQHAGASAEESRRLQAFTAAPLTVLPSAELFELSGAVGPFIRRDDTRRPDLERAAIAMIRDPHGNALTQREVVDEFGWRHYGDLWADNERGGHGAPREGGMLISHYNQEYDWGFSMLLQALRNSSVDPQAALDYFKLGRAALRHEADVDTYHCWPREIAQDGVYCGGHFTHTGHGIDAGDSGHRGSPSDKYWGKLDWPWGRGGGPESGHFHTRGQWLLYFLTGERRHLESALERTAAVEYKLGEEKFPQWDNCGRDVGHSMQVLVDAWEATGLERYVELAKKLVEASHFGKSFRDKAEHKPMCGDFSNAIYMREHIRLLDALTDRGHTGDSPLYRAALESVVSFLDVTLEKGWAGPDEGFYSWVRGNGEHGFTILPRGADGWNLMPTNGMLADCFAQVARHIGDPSRRGHYQAVARLAFDLDQRASQNGSPLPVYRNCKVATNFCRSGFTSAAILGL